MTSGFLDPSPSPLSAIANWYSIEFTQPSLYFIFFLGTPPPSPLPVRTLFMDGPLGFFPDQIGKKEETEGKVKAFMSEFIAVMMRESNLESFIADIVIDGEGNVWIVELNPFGELAGSCLFRCSVARWQNLIPSFPWIVEGVGAQSKERKGSSFAA